MKKRYVLIDYENVHNIDLKPLLNQEIHIMVFHSEDQKFTSDFTTRAIDLGKEKIELIKMKGHGKNALDFHIAFFMGKLLRNQKDLEFYVISKDNGFEPLVNFIKDREEIPAYIKPSVADIPMLKHNDQIAKDNYQFVVKTLSDPARLNKPKTMIALKKEIFSKCGRKISDLQVEEMIIKLKTEEIIECDGGKIIYKKT